VGHACRDAVVMLALRAHALGGETALSLGGETESVHNTDRELPTRQSREARHTPHTRDSRSARVSLTEPESVTPYTHGESASILVGFLKISIPDTAQKKEREGRNPARWVRSLHSSPALDVRLMTALQVLQVLCCRAHFGEIGTPTKNKLHKKIARAGTCSFLPISQ